jgi:hypothetical protein
MSTPGLLIANGGSVEPPLGSSSVACADAGSPNSAATIIAASTAALTARRQGVPLCCTVNELTSVLLQLTCIWNGFSFQFKPL